MGRLNKDFQHDGYVALAKPLDADALSMLQRVCDELLDEKPQNGGEGLHDIGLGRRRQFLRHRHPDYPELEAFLLQGPPARLACDLFGVGAFLFNEQFVVKGPKKGASFAWHQDGAYVGFDHKPYLTVWIALDDATEENGCVYLLPRNLKEKPGIDPHEWVEESSELNGYFGSDQGEAVVVPAGAVVGFSSLTLHRSGPNITDRPRRAYICQYSAEQIIDPETNQLKRFGTEVSPA